jgi:molybdenum cofactor cytidylyltransferase
VIVAVVPAAGHSTRMGRPKLSLPLGNRSILEHAVTALRAGGADRVVVVIGPHVPELIPLAEAAGADVCRLAEPTPDMRATVEHGLRWVEDHLHSPPDLTRSVRTTIADLTRSVRTTIEEDAWLLAPADHPALDPRAVRDLCNFYLRDPSHSILIPVHGGRRGHPALIAWRHVAGIRALAPDRGINAYFREHATDVREVPVSSAGVLCDLDTPEDYERLRRTWGAGS